MASSKEGVIAAYRRAWRGRRTLGETDVGLLLRELEPVLAGVDGEIRAEVQELLVSCWERGIGPRRLHYEMARQALHALLSPLALFTSSPQEPDAWMCPPAGVEPLSLEPGESMFMELALAVSPEAGDVLSDARDAPEESDDWHLAPVWLRPSGPEGTLEVLIGDRPVGHVGLPPLMWQELGREAREGRFATGELGVRGTEAGDVEVGHVRCTLPRVAP